MKKHFYLYHPINGFDHERMEYFACSNCHSEYYDDEIEDSTHCPHCEVEWDNPIIKGEEWKEYEE